MSNELKHYGVLGMKWGVRRYQNPDGALTSAGKKRYAAKDTDSIVTKKVKKDLSQMTSKEFRKKYQVTNTRYMKRVDRYGDPYMNSPLAKLGKRMEAEAKKNAERYINKAEKNKNKRNKQTEARVKELIEKYGDKYTITQTKDGYILKDGKDEWKVR